MTAAAFHQIAPACWPDWCRRKRNYGRARHHLSPGLDDKGPHRQVPSLTRGLTDAYLRRAQISGDGRAWLPASSRANLRDVTGCTAPARMTAPASAVFWRLRWSFSAPSASTGTFAEKWLRGPEQQLTRYVIMFLTPLKRSFLYRQQRRTARVRKKSCSTSFGLQLGDGAQPAPPEHLENTRYTDLATAIPGSGAPPGVGAATALTNWALCQRCSGRGGQKSPFSDRRLRLSAVSLTGNSCSMQLLAGAETSSSCRCSGC
jgi:hypothetical protein